MQKKHLLHHLAVFAAALTFSSCASLWGDGLPYINKIHQGQSQEEVASIMKGNPQYRRFAEDGLEQWEYHKNRDASGNYDVVIIGFRDGRVVNMNSFYYQVPIVGSVEKK